MMTEDDLVKIIDNEKAQSSGGSEVGEDSELVESWNNAMNYYYGKERGDEVEGRSKVISMDVADMIEQTVAQIMPAFDHNDLAEFDAYDVLDEEQAKVESDACNWVIMNENNGFITFMSAIKNSLLQRNGIVKVYIEEKTEIEEEVVENINAIGLNQIASNPDVDITEYSIVQQGETVAEELYTIKVRRKTKTKQCKVVPTPAEEISINSDHNSIFLEDARVVIHTTTEYTRSDLIAMGYDPEVVDLIPAHTTDSAESKLSRSRDDSENDHTSADRATDKIKLEDVYMLVDFDEDGIAERRRIIKAESYILENEIFPIVPFSAGTCFLLPNKFWNLSMFDKLKQTQDTKTAFLRKTLDNAEGMINQRVIAVNGQVNMEDLLSSRPTGVVRAKRTDAVAPYPVQNMGDLGFRMLGYMDKVRKEAGGAQLDIGTTENIPVQGQTAHGMERWMSSQEHLSHLMVKTQAETLIKGTFRITHALMRKYMPERISYKSNGKYITTIPGTWPKRSKVTINIQDSMAERQRKYVVLQNIFEAQKQLYDSGAEDIMVNESHMYNVLYDQSKVAGLNNIERYWQNPKSPQAIEAGKQKQKAQQEASQKAQQENDKLLKVQLQIQEMSDRADLVEAELKNQIAINEQLRKWYELEFKYKKDVPGQGGTAKEIQ